jgi:hypothetical protein
VSVAARRSNEDVLLGAASTLAVACGEFLDCLLVAGMAGDLAADALGIVAVMVMSSIAHDAAISCQAGWARVSSM